MKCYILYWIFFCMSGSTVELDFFVNVVFHIDCAFLLCLDQLEDIIFLFYCDNSVIDSTLWKLSMCCWMSNKISSGILFGLDVCLPLLYGLFFPKSESTTFFDTSNVSKRNCLHTSIFSPWTSRTWRLVTFLLLFALFKILFLGTSIILWAKNYFCFS